MSEWQMDGNGRRYRMIGNIKEYEMTVNGIPVSELAEHNRRIKEQRQLDTVTEAPGNCPFRTGLNTSCTLEKCAFYTDGCLLAKYAPAKDTAGLQCPLTKGHYICSSRCSLYSGGCALTGLMKKGLQNE